MNNGRTRKALKRTAPIVVVKLGGELLEDAEKTRALASSLAQLSRRVALVVVHGGGREIDAALAQAAIPKRQVDGLRVTDEATLRVVVAVLAGSINTRLVAAINAAGGKAVGLTGADAEVAPVTAAKPHRAANGDVVDLGLVGEPVRSGSPGLLRVLTANGYLPVIACIGGSRGGQLFNVNADTLAASLATRLGAARLVIAGGTPGVLDTNGTTLPVLEPAAITALVQAGTASAGMVAKLDACRRAVRDGVGEVFIVDGRDPRRLLSVGAGTAAERGAWTRITGRSATTKGRSRASARARAHAD